MRPARSKRKIGRLLENLREPNIWGMATPVLDREHNRSPYSACESQPVHYAAIGAALQLNQPQKFRHQVAFVPTEALESYLDDLLDTTVSDAILCIARRFTLSTAQATLAGISLCAIPLAAGLAVTANGGGFVAALLVTGILACPASYLLSKFFTERSLSRRMRFAQVVSGEIARRRGLGMGTMTPLFNSEFPRLRDVLSFSPWSGPSAELRN